MSWLTINSKSAQNVQRISTLTSHQVRPWYTYSIYDLVGNRMGNELACLCESEFANPFVGGR